MRIGVIAAVMATATLLAGCNFKGVPEPSLSQRDAEWMALVPKGGPSDPHLERWQVKDPTGEPPGTIVVATKERVLYFVLPEGKAIRYGVAVGDQAYGWTGTAHVARKAEWPDWTPPAEMKKRWPHVRFTKGGPENPLGARALYLYEGNKDTLYRIHGTNDPQEIGQAVSSGCIRMRNIDVVDLYNRVPANTKVIVK